MARRAGFYMPLSLPRRLICDFLTFAARVPTVPVQRRLSVASVAAARDAASPRPGWGAIFVKAWAMVCARHPALRRAYIGGPWPRLYQHAATAASIAIERPYGDEEAVFFLHLKRPEERALTEIHDRIHHFKQRELGSSGSLRRQLRLARLPGVLRRLIWRVGLGFGAWRERFFGTFGMTSYGGLGASSLHPVGLLTTTLTYGPISPAGEVDARVVYDHRALDGGAVARALADLQAVLDHEVLAELRYLQSVPDVGAAAVA